VFISGNHQGPILSLDSAIRPSGNLPFIATPSWSPEPLSPVVDNTMQIITTMTQLLPSPTPWCGAFSTPIDDCDMTQPSQAITSDTTKSNQSFVGAPFTANMDGSSNQDITSSDWMFYRGRHTWPDTSQLAEYLQEPRCFEHGCDGRRFSTMSNLRRHQRERNRLARRMVCPWCEATFYRKWTRNQHILRGSCRPFDDITFWQAYAANAARGNNAPSSTGP
jgi:hypothetical protein